MANTIKFSDVQITEISKILGDVLTGSEISSILSRINVEDNSGQLTKWRRLDYVFSEQQRINNSGNVILRFIKESISPVKYVNNATDFEKFRLELNKILLFQGIEYKDDGNFRIVEKANTISEVQLRTKSLMNILIQRGAHQNVIKFCKAELLVENYFHSVLEAAKSLLEVIREKSGSAEDGNELINKAFSINNPLLVFNSLSNENEKNVQKGYAEILRGLCSLVRNTTAHSPKIKWVVNEKDAVDILMTISFMHRVLDDVIIVPKR